MFPGPSPEQRRCCLAGHTGAEGAGGACGGGDGAARDRWKSRNHRDENEKSVSAYGGECESREAPCCEVLLRQDSGQRT